MTKARVPETNEGIQGVNLVDLYDQMQRSLRDKGWMETESLIKSGITAGYALEVGYGRVIWVWNGSNVARRAA
jgi:hypothetical protein